MTSSTNSKDRNAKSDRPERLFRSAVSSYCALVRPTKRDAAQFDDLTLPLLPLVSTEGRRYAAAALSEMGAPATMLVRRLAEEPVEVSAPLLTRSVNLGDVDLIGLIGRHGVGHAQAIGRRKGLNANIAKLIKALGAAHAGSEEVKTMDAVAAEPENAAMTMPAERPNDRAEDVRVQLREMMLPARDRPAERDGAIASPIDWPAASAAYPKLLSSALTGSDVFFHTAIADALGISYGAAQMLGDDQAPSVTAVLNALDLSVEQAFLVATLVFPYALVGHESASDFVKRYRKLEVDASRQEVSAWCERHAEHRSVRARDWEPVAEKPANDTGAGGMQALRAS